MLRLQRGGRGSSPRWGIFFINLRSKKDKNDDEDQNEDLDAN